MEGSMLRLSALKARARRNQGGAGGCILGCLVALGLVVLVVALLIYFGISMFNQVLDQFTDTAPVKLPASTLSAEDTQAVWDRVDDFKTAVEAETDATCIVVGVAESVTL